MIYIHVSDFASLTNNVPCPIVSTNHVETFVTALVSLVGAFSHASVSMEVFDIYLSTITSSYGAKLVVIHLVYVELHLHHTVVL